MLFVFINVLIMNFGNFSSNSTMNEELLLKVICNYPAIYDPQRKGYSNRQMTDRAWENVALSVKYSVEECKKKWKSLRGKFYREKQKITSLSRSGMEFVQIPTWPFMSFFEFMFENRTPRETSASILLDNNQTEINRSSTVTSMHVTTDEEAVPEGTSISDRNLIQNMTEDLHDFERSSCTDSHLLSNNENYVPLADHTSVEKDRRGKKRKADTPDPILGVLGDISLAVKNVSKLESNKACEFAKYMAAELNDLPKPASNEFIDETLISNKVTSAEKKISPTTIT